MRVCPRCVRSTKESERIEKDPNSDKHWFITFCARCTYNYDLEVYAGAISSPQEELDKYPELPVFKPWYNQ